MGVGSRSKIFLSVAFGKTAPIIGTGVDEVNKLG
jgi:hypothetical protein